MKNNKIKTIGQVFTPEHIIEKILSAANYKGGKIVGKTILEPSFGDGRFIIKILDRLIFECKEKGMSEKTIADLINETVYGIELDAETYFNGVSNVQQFVFERLGVEIPFDNLICGDTLKLYKKYENKFDFVLGNPPYINVHQIKDRSVFNEFYFTKKGSSDLYLAFFDAGIQMLNDTGNLCFITPSLWMYNKTGQIMRDYITQWPILHKIIDFGHEQIFSGFTTYTSITLLSKRTTGFFLEYEKDDVCETKRYEDIFLNNHFCFTDLHSIKEYREIFKVSYNGLCQVRNGYATLCDKFFIDNKELPENKYMIPVCKSSLHTMHSCFYPYDANGNIVSFEEIEKENKPLSEYLLKCREMLQKRAIDKGGCWYGFGRNQAIKDTYSTKYGINSIIKEGTKIQLTECKSRVGVYGGLYIKTEESKEKIEGILNSEHFFRFVQSVGMLKAGGYYQFSSGQLEKYLNFMLLTEKLKENVVVYTTCFDFIEKIKIIDRMKNEYGIYYNAVAEDECEAGFWLKEFGKTVFFTEKELRENCKVLN